MSKFFALVIVIILSSVLFSTAHTRKFKSHHKVQPVTFRMPGASVSADSILQFAETLIGTRYRAGSSSPTKGFDCSGFVNYVFKKFNFVVPRSSCDFINIGQKIKLQDARPGDIILFTGTSRHSRRIGHVAIVYYNDGGQFKFIHSTSGKEHGVTITDIDKTYKRRYVQVIRVLG